GDWDRLHRPARSHSASRAVDRASEDGTVLRQWRHAPEANCNRIGSGPCYGQSRRHEGIATRKSLLILCVVHRSVWRPPSHRRCLGADMIDSLIVIPFEPVTSVMLDPHMRSTYLAQVAFPLESANVELEEYLGVDLNYWERGRRPMISGRELSFPRM